MGSPDTILPSEQKAVAAVIEELQRQALENASRLKVRLTRVNLRANDEIDVDSWLGGHQPDGRRPPKES